MKQTTSYSFATGQQSCFNAVKHCLITVVLLLAVFQPANAQETDSTGNDPKYYLSLSYGIGALFFTPDIQSYSVYDFDSTVMQGSSTLEELSTDLKIKPFLVKFDMKISPKSSLGVQLIYNGFTATGIRIDSVWVPATETHTITQKNTSYTMNRFRVQLTFTKHFYHKNPLFESYFYTGLGWSRKYRKYQVGNELYNFREAPVSGTVNFPVSIRLAYGLRFHVSERSSLQAEFGFGGPLVSIGLSTRF
ncbi:MAG: hypothetical protein A3D31_01985 [Candidatus Fluviicola riflensis]|nr:MAG: hypothetical protein CHH17_13050 [Candidatus Fluviicola riflensis]OGS78767.1 MAG: hypothetical protein A3D31_01985 [Candidatus Fluviicola riflensis]OGS86198.1 MAG: hypothetical protein A2724_01440 [Fluviicola sp. RIFCSPHIGHO2_01_FULL_43_53]OGS87729.1 MAG: hypothetical protein A3E30_16650 [Fluviicola sp. RIFCSPHIGHO2_12_FULL_43_24]